MYIFGVVTFYFGCFKIQKKVLKSSSTFFGKSEPKEEIVQETVKETSKQLWERINDQINQNKWRIVNIETVYKNCFTTGGQFPREVEIRNDTKYNCYDYSAIVGYRVFYKTKIIRDIDMATVGLMSTASGTSSNLSDVSKTEKNN